MILVVTSFAPVVISSEFLYSLAFALKVFPLNSLITLYSIVSNSKSSSTITASFELAFEFRTTSLSPLLFSSPYKAKSIA